MTGAPVVVDVNVYDHDWNGLTEGTDFELVYLDEDKTELSQRIEADTLRRTLHIFCSFKGSKSISFRLRKLADFYRYWNDYYTGTWSSYIYIAWSGDYYYNGGYYDGGYYDEYYYYANKRRDTENLDSSVNQPSEALPRVVRHGSRVSE